MINKIMYYQSKVRPQYFLKVEDKTINHYNTSGVRGQSIVKDKTRITQYLGDRFDTIFESDFNELIK